MRNPRMIQRSAIGIAVGAICCMALAVDAANSASRPVGVIRVTLAPGSQALLALGVDPFDNRIAAIFAGQLTGGLLPAYSDNILLWNNGAAGYDTYWKDLLGAWKKYPDSLETTNTLSPGIGFWAVSRQDFTQQMFFAGSVVLDETNGVGLPPSLSLLACPFSSKIALSNAGLRADGAFGAAVQTDADQITEPIGNTTVWLLDDTNSPQHGRWVDATTNPAALELTLGRGYWYSHQSTGFVWSVARPYSNLFPGDDNPPLVTAMTLNAQRDEVTLGIASTGSGERLEIYFKDLVSTGAFVSAPGWNIAQLNLTSAGTSLDWTDSGSGGRGKVNEVFARFYLVGAAGVDADADGLPDARETFVHGTDPTGSDTDGEGMPDGWEVLYGLNPLANDAGDDPDMDELTNLEEYLNNTDPNNADTDGDGMPDGWEINSGLNPRSDLIAEGLAAWWRFEEGTGGTAGNSVGTNYAGSLQNMDSSNWTNGPLGGALSFDGTDDFVAVQQTAPIVSGGDFTVAGLVYLKGDYGENFQTIVSDSKLRPDDFSVAAGGVPGGWFGGSVTGSGTTNAATDGNANWSVPSSGNHQECALFGGSGSANSTTRQRNSFIAKPVIILPPSSLDPQEWAFNISYDSSNATGPSDENRLRVWLWANSTNISSANGYAVEYGEDGSNDTVRLFRMSNGAKVTPAIASGSASVQAGDVQFSVRVRRSAGGVWQMWNLFNTSASNAFPVSDPTTVTNNPQQGTNNAIAVGGTGNVGVQAFINTSASSSRNLALDDLSVNGQITGFNLRHRDAINGGAGDSTNTTFATVSNSARPFLDCWQSVAFSHDGTNARLHVAGNPATNVPARFAAALQSQLLIGRDHSETAHSHLCGAIDDLRIYTRALSDSEVGDLYDRLGDADGDGRDNFQEYQAGTDPNSAASFPAAISGSIAYSGSQTGYIWVVASPSSDGFPTNRSVKISFPGDFTLPGVPTLDHYWLNAFLDANGDGVPSPCEARGSYLANPVYLTNAVDGIVITLTDDTNAPTLSGVPSVAAVEHGNIPTPPTVTARDSYEGSVSVTLSQTTNALPDFQLYAGSVAQGLNGYLLTGFTNALVGCGSISHETFSEFAVSPPSYAALATTLDGITCVIQHLDDDGTLNGVVRAFQVEDPVSQGGATGAGAGIDENSGSTTNRNRFVFTFDVPVGFVGLDALDLESSSAGTLATLRAYDADSNLLFSTNLIYPNNENGDGQIHFIGLTSDKADIGILTVTVGDTSGDGNSQHLAFDNLRFGTAAAADYEILRVWSAADSCGNGVAATQVIAVVEIAAPPMPGFPEDGPFDSPVWINELHYDNAGVDTGEGVEIAGWADISLGDYQLVFYSGENGKVYKTVPLSGVMGDEGCGVGTIWFPIPGIQNGLADGLALVKDRLAVKQFLSYEGALVASNGPAAGFASTPIAVAESATTPPGKSLQLLGVGEYYDAFTWHGPTNATPGSVNLAQIFPCPQPPEPRRPRQATKLIEIVGISWFSNAMEVVIASTNNSGSIPVDLFSCDVGGTNGTFRGLGSLWSLATANLILAGTNPVTFTDTGQLGRPHPSAISSRFYAAARSDVDTDGDGLTDGAEKFAYHTNPGTNDTDDDGMPDG